MQIICITFVQHCTNVIQMFCVYWGVPIKYTAFEMYVYM